MSETTRRSFLMGCSAAIAAMAGSRFTSMAFGAPGNNEEVMVVVFLRGGMDGLNFVMPIDGADRGHYEAGRPNLAVPVTGPDAALALDAQFGMHPGAVHIQDLYQDGKVSFVLAAGLDEPNRSHFDAMRSMELGSAGATSPTGWLTRHLESASNLPSNLVMPALALGNLQQASLLGSDETVNMASPSSFALNTGPSQWRLPQRLALRRMLQNGSDWLHASSTQALDALDVVELNVGGGYTPANGADYPSGSFGDQLQTIAQIIKLGLGLRVVTIDLGGWDTHNGQGDGSGGYFSSRIGLLTQGLKALYVDLDGVPNHTQRLTCVVQSEFGRRLRQNADRGTDHGHGNVMTILSGNAIGGLHGNWPGLANDQLFDGADLAVTTDYRQVFSELLIRRLGNTHLGTIFPGYTNYTPLGLVAGTDLPPDYGSIAFQDGFESGDASAWTAAVGQ